MPWSKSSGSKPVITIGTRNRAAMGSLRTAVKAARAAVDGNAGDAKDLVKTAIANVDKAVSRGILKRKTASRYVSRLSTRTAAE